MDLILASASPRRRQLLDSAGIRCRVRPADIDETVCPGETADHFVRRVAQEKAWSIAQLSPVGSLVLGADTVVEIAGEILGKPKDASDAQRMLRLLSGRDHRVLTGVCVVRAPNSVEALQHEITRVSFSALEDGEIQRYIASGEPFDKAGAYAIQGLASKFAVRIDGCFFNVVGLPVPLVYRLLKRLAAITCESSASSKRHEPD
jgi:septum formation protein